MGETKSGEYLTAGRFKTPVTGRGEDAVDGLLDTVELEDLHVSNTMN